MYKIIGADKKEYGPVAADVLRQWFATGRVNGQTLARAEGGTEMKPLGNLPEFADLFLTSKSLPPLIAPPAPSSGGGLNMVIPYKNPKALAAYYTGVFSIIPFLGLVLGPIGFACGILGLRYRRENPTAGGAVHAWVGIIVGGLCGLANLAIIIAGVAAIAHAHH